MKFSLKGTGRRGLTRLEVILSVAIAATIGVCVFLVIEPYPRYITIDGVTTDLQDANESKTQPSLFRRLFSFGGKADSQQTNNIMSINGHSLSDKRNQGEHGTNTTAGSSAFPTNDAMDLTLLTQGLTGAKPNLPKISGKSKKAPEPSLVDAFKAAIESEDPLAAFSSGKLQKLSLEEVHQCLEMLGEMEWGPQANVFLRGLMAQWGALDPISAMQYATQIDSRRTRSEVMSSIVGSWAKNDPNAALAWVMSNASKDRTLASASLTPVFRSLAAKDPAMAMLQVWSLPDQSMKKTALRSVMGTMDAMQREEMLLGLYGQMVPGPDKTLLAESLIETWSRYEPERAANWIMQNATTPAEQSRTIGRLMTYWGYDRPQEAADWMSQLPASTIRRTEMGRVTQTWAQDDLRGAASWVQQFPPSTQMDPSIQSIALAYAKEDGQTAISWAQTITDAKLKQRTIQQVALEWMKYNPNAARPYLTIPKTSKKLP